MKKVPDDIQIGTDLNLDDCDAGQRSCTRAISARKICTGSRHKAHMIAGNKSGPRKVDVCNDTE